MTMTCTNIHLANRFKHTQGCMIAGCIRAVMRKQKSTEKKLPTYKYDIQFSNENELKKRQLSKQK